MTILQLISSEGMYGAENMLLSLSAALTTCGHRVIVAVFEDSRNAHVELAVAAQTRGFETVRIPCSGRWDSQAIKRLRALLDQYGVDVLHAHGYKADLYGFAAARGRRVALVSTCHNWPDPRLLMRAYAVLDRLVLRRFAAVTTPSASVARILTAAGIAPGKVRVVRNGIDCAPF